MRQRTPIRSLPAALPVLGLLLAPLHLHAQASGRRALTIADVFDPARRSDPVGIAPGALSWLDDAHYHWARTDAKSRLTEHLKVEAASGRVTPLVDAPKLEATLVRDAGLSPEDARGAARQRRYAADWKTGRVLVPAGGDLYLYEVAADRARRLTSVAGEEKEADFSPDGRSVSFVRNHDLHVVPAAGGPEVRLTTDGSDDVLNGILDWLYQEEIYGRGVFRGYWWSPDSKQIAFLRLDETGVPRYTLVDDIPYHPEVEVTPYPKAGDPNPKVRLGVVAASGGPVAWVPTERHGADILLVRVTWTRDGQKLAYQVQDRAQTWLQLELAEPGRGPSRTLLRETTRAWVEVLDEPRWLPDGGFLWQSEKSGHRHVYRHDREGRLLNAVTSGPWDVRSLLSVDEKAGAVYVSAFERSPVGVDVYRVPLSGGPPKRLSEAPGTHTANFNPAATLYLDTFSDLATPPQLRVHRADGTLVRVADEGRFPLLDEVALARPEPVRVKARDGHVLHGLLIKPPDFDPKRRYPVLQHTYAGPQAAQVRNAWGGPTHLFLHALAARGIVGFVLDNRTASGPAEQAWHAWGRAGEPELRDLEDGVAWLKAQPWVDGSKIGLSGWSYGGFMVAYALTHSRSFAMGISGAPVTDWRDYDSVYTERLMKLPSENAEGYKATAPRHAAADLSGALLLIHGMMDDNVHPQNTMQLAYALQKANKPFRLMVYPKQRHGFTDPALVFHLRTMMAEFAEETLLGRAAAR